LLKAIRDEKDLIASLTRLGLSSKQAYELISDSVIGQAQTEEDPADGTVDASDKLEDGNAITWWNDIEKDSR
jgi:UDP-glucose:glycoprotein glucosyltransferase